MKIKILSKTSVLQYLKLYSLPAKFWSIQRRPIAGLVDFKVRGCTFFLYINYRYIESAYEQNIFLDSVLYSMFVQQS